MLLDSCEFISTNTSDFPYNLCFYKLGSIDFRHAITFLVGDNGSGKSTLLELIQEKLELIRIEQPSLTLKALRHKLASAKGSISLKYRRGRPRGFYFGAEDFTSYIHQLTLMKVDAEQELARVKDEFSNRSIFAQGQAASPFMRTIYEINNLYDRDLLSSSHGEAYLSFFNSRIRENELYILDEPETPLSVQNQLALMVMIHEAIKKGCQFIIATHSPILLAYPDARIYQFSKDNVPIVVDYNNLEQLQLLKQFLSSPEAFFHHMFK